MLSWARATDGTTVRGSPDASMFTSTDGSAPVRSQNSAAALR